jgi:hypothetical protein
MMLLVDVMILVFPRNGSAVLASLGLERIFGIAFSGMETSLLLRGVAGNWRYGR